MNTRYFLGFISAAQFLAMHIFSSSNESIDSTFSTKRKTFKKTLSSYQLEALENFYQNFNKLPRHKAKLELADRYDIDKFVLNKWFQARRNKDPIFKAEKLKIKSNL